ncbi:MAG TPA: hypothetical protein GX707_02940, partial [Epulopiscium sp.]|nr:hypothetical protein [Candidatus Epulonipiscium sp.]
ANLSALVSPRAITLTATINMGTSNTEKEFTVRVIARGETNAERLAADTEWLTDSAILNGNSSLDNIIGDLTLPTVGPNESTITWESNKDTIVDVGGKVTRLDYTHGDQTVILMATISNGSVSNTKSFTLKVKSLGQTGDEKDREKLDLDAEWLIDKLTSGQDLNNIIENLILDTKGKNGSTISWASSDEQVVRGNFQGRKLSM